jgi:hypothetical protein
MRRPTIKELEGLSIDELSELRDKIREMLLVSIAEEKRALQDRLKLLKHLQVAYRARRWER